MRKILILVPSLGIGGQEKIAINNYNILKKYYDVKFAVFFDVDRKYSFNDQILNLSVKNSKSVVKKIIIQFKRINKLKKLIKEKNIDLVYSFGSSANITSSLVKFFVRVKVLVAIHGNRSIKKSIMNKFVWTKADAIICISQAMKYKVDNLYKSVAKKTYLLENGYNINEIMKLSQENHNLDQGVISISAMGRVEPVKGFEHLISAFALFKNEYNNSKLYIIGTGSLIGNLQGKVKELKLCNSVEFLGYQNNPYKIIGKTDIFVLSSFNEGFPNSLVEALACETPIVAIDCDTGPREILTDKFDIQNIDSIKCSDYGILVKKYTENQESETEFLLYSAIKTLYESEELYDHYKKKSISRAFTYDIKHYEEKLMHIISII